MYSQESQELIEPRTGRRNLPAQMYGVEGKCFSKRYLGCEFVFSKLKADNAFTWTLRRHDILHFSSLQGIIEFVIFWNAHPPAVICPGLLFGVSMLSCMVSYKDC